MSSITEVTAKFLWLFFKTLVEVVGTYSACDNEGRSIPVDVPPVMGGGGETRGFPPPPPHLVTSQRCGESSRQSGMGHRGVQTWYTERERHTHAQSMGWNYAALKN